MQGTIESPAAWAGVSLVSAIGIAAYLTKQISNINTELEKHESRLTSTILELSKMKPLGDNVLNLTKAINLMNIEGGKQRDLIKEVKTSICELDAILDGLIHQVNVNSQQTSLSYKAISELQDLAKQNGWKIRANLPKFEQTTIPQHLVPSQDSDYQSSNRTNYYRPGQPREHYPSRNRSIYNTPYSQPSNYHGGRGSDPRKIYQDGIHSHGSYRDNPGQIRRNSNLSRGPLGQQIGSQDGPYPRSPHDMGPIEQQAKPVLDNRPNNQHPTPSDRLLVKNLDLDLVNLNSQRRSRETAEEEKAKNDILSRISL